MCRRQMFLVSYLTHLMHLLENFIGRCNSDKKKFYLSNAYDARRLLNKFSAMSWQLGNIGSLLKRIRKRQDGYNCPPIMQWQTAFGV